MRDRETMRAASVIDSVRAGPWLAIALGYICLGNRQAPGTFRGMARGTESEDRVKPYYNLWCEHLKGSGSAGADEEEPRAARSRPGAEPSH
jgi:hypothetical protein